MQPLKVFCTANIISPSFSKRKAATTMSSGLCQWDAQQRPFLKLDQPHFSFVIINLQGFHRVFYVYFIYDSCWNTDSTWSSHFCLFFFVVWFIYGKNVTRCCETTSYSIWVLFISLDCLWREVSCWLFFWSIYNVNNTLIFVKWILIFGCWCTAVPNLRSLILMLLL